MTSQMLSDQERMVSIFLPYVHDQRLRVRKQNIRFVHYTTADAAMHILREKSVWMRNSSCMNDYSEVSYGLTQLKRTYSTTKAGQEFKAALNRIFAGITHQIDGFFKESEMLTLMVNTYLTCVSEHEDEEDEHGRLSMWRAYGHVTGVAMVFNNPVFMDPSDGLAAYATPVAYLGDLAFEKEFARITDNINREADFIRARGQEEIIRRVRGMLWFASVSSKHPGFKEEKEWRVLRCPTLESSPHIKKEILSINGVPQPVYKLPLDDIPAVSLVASIPRLISRIIVGPARFPVALGYAFQKLLADAGVPDPDNRLYLSRIPLRR